MCFVRAFEALNHGHCSSQLPRPCLCKAMLGGALLKAESSTMFGMHWRHDDDGLSGGVPVPAKRPQLRVSESRGKWGIP